MAMFRALKAEEIDVRIGQKSKTNNACSLLLYKNARIDADILDETVGAMGWQKSYSRDNANCTVSIWDSEKQQWISKEDTGTASNAEAQKGMASDSFKRACVMWGIGRELYTSPFIWISDGLIEFDQKNNVKGTIFVKSVTVSDDKKITSLVIGYKNRGTTTVIFSFNSSEKVGSPIYTSNTNTAKPVNSSATKPTTKAASKSANATNTESSGGSLSKEDCDPAVVVYAGGYHKGKTVAKAAEAAGGLNTVKWYASQKLGNNAIMYKQILASQRYLEENPV